MLSLKDSFLNLIFPFSWKERQKFFIFRLLVNKAPPSPVVIVFIAWKLVIAISENLQLPLKNFSYLPPKECEQSSIILKPYFLDKLNIFFCSWLQPPKWTTIRIFGNLLFFVFNNFSLSFIGQILRVSLLIST